MGGGGGGERERERERESRKCWLPAFCPFLQCFQNVFFFFAFLSFHRRHQKPSWCSGVVKIKGLNWLLLVNDVHRLVVKK